MLFLSRYLLIFTAGLIVIYRGKQAPFWIGYLMFSGGWTLLAALDDSLARAFWGYIWQLSGETRLSIGDGVHAALYSSWIMLFGCIGGVIALAVAGSANTPQAEVEVKERLQ